MKLISCSHSQEVKLMISEQILATFCELVLAFANRIQPFSDSNECVLVLHGFRTAVGISLGEV